MISNQELRGRSKLIDRYFRREEKEARRKEKDFYWSRSKGCLIRDWIWLIGMIVMVGIGLTICQVETGKARTKPERGEERGQLAFERYCDEVEGRF